MRYLREISEKSEQRRLNLAVSIIKVGKYYSRVHNRWNEVFFKLLKKPVPLGDWLETKS